MRTRQSAVRYANALDDGPSFLESLHHIFRQRSTLEAPQVLFKLRRTTCADDDGVTTFPLHCAVVARPSQSRLPERHIMSLSRVAENIKRSKVSIVPVTTAEVLALEASRIVAATGLVGHRVTLVLPSEQAAGQWAERVEGDTIRAQAWEELRLHTTLQSVVAALVDVGLLPAVAVAELADLGDFPGAVVAQAEAEEVAGAVEVVYCFEGLCVGCVVLTWC